MELSRKGFFTAFGAAGAAAAVTGTAFAAAEEGERVPVHFRVLKPGQYNHAAMQAVFQSSKRHKQVFQSMDPVVVAPGIASLYIHMQNAMNCYEFSYGFGRGSLQTLGVLIGASVVLALNDDLWKKYGLGPALKLANTNLYYRATSNLSQSASPDDPNGIYQDWSAQAVMARGGKFMVCHNALTAVAALFSKAGGTTPEAALREFEAGILPGFIVVPAGVAAVSLAQEHGYSTFAII